MRFYVCSRLEDQERADEVARLLAAAGHTRTYDWGRHGSLQSRPDLWRTKADAEAAGVVRAEFVVVLLPGGRGTHVELGVAIGAGRRVYLVGRETQTRTCLFYHHPFVTQVATVADLLEAVGPDRQLNFPTAVDEVDGFPLATEEVRHA